MNECQTHLVALARAHVEGLVLDAFHDGVARAPSPGLSEVLAGLADLYALERLDAHAAWFLERGYFEPRKSRAIRGLPGGGNLRRNPGMRALPGGRIRHSRQGSFRPRRRLRRRLI